MNKSQSSSSPSPQRFAAEQAFFESLEDLDEIIVGSDSQKTPSQTESLPSKSSENSNFPSWDDIAEDIEQALHDISDEE